MVASQSESVGVRIRRADVDVKSRKKWMSQFKQREWRVDLPFLFFFVLFGPSKDSEMATYIEKDCLLYSILNTPVQMSISSGNTLTHPEIKLYQVSGHPLPRQIDTVKLIIKHMLSLFEVKLH